MDPAARGRPDESGFVAVTGCARVHYELFKPCAGSAAGGRVLVVMGAFATSEHFASTARFIADNSGHEVCMYDHRGVGKSGAPVMEQQTSAMLAADALLLLEAVWGGCCAVHVYGASMGGMVAQELALLLLPQGRLLSLMLGVTCRGLKPLGGLLGPLFVPQVLKPVLQAWYWDSRPKLVRRVMRLVLSRNVLDDLHPSGQTYEQVYFREWLARFDELWTFADHTAGACHAAVVLTHYTSERNLALLRDSGVPILCQVSTRDHLIPPALQFELAHKLRAKTVTFPTGHMGLLPWKERYHAMLLEHFGVGDAMAAVAQRQAARGWAMSCALLSEWRLLRPQEAAAPAAGKAAALLLPSRPSGDGSSSGSDASQLIGTVTAAAAGAAAGERLAPSTSTSSYSDVTNMSVELLDECA